MNIHATIAPMAAKILPHVRLATEADIPQLLEMGRQLHVENGLMNVSEHLIEIAVRKAARGEGMVCGVIGDVGHVEAMIGLLVARYWYSLDSHLEEILSFVKYEYRKSDNAKALIEFAKDCALKLNVPLLIGIVSNHRTEQKVRLYQRRLGKPAGAYFLFNSRTGKTDGR
jgi:hypothetical protein